MFSSRHSFDPHHKKDPKGVIDKNHIFDRIIDRNENILKSSGTPMTLWKYFPFGPECTCKKDKMCKTCYGTGFLNGYQKYGYYTYTFSSNSVGRDDRYGLNLTNVMLVDLPGRHSKAFKLTSGTTGFIETNWIPASQTKEHAYIKSMIFTPENTSVTYAYTIDGVNYTSIFDLQIPIDIPVTDNVKFRITLSRTSINYPSPALNLIRYRARIKDEYQVYDSKKHYGGFWNDDNRFDETNIPAFLASKQVMNRNYKMSQEGTTVRFEPKYWALPDVKITERDIGMFLQGNHQNKRFEFQQITTSEHGENNRVLHTDWLSRFIFDDKDVLGIAYSLD